MTASSPTTPAASSIYPESEEEIVTGKKASKEKTSLSTPELVELLREYWTEAETARRTGVDAREYNWRANWNAYWGRNDSTDKAEWQADEQMPEVANFVDRHTAALRLALMSNPDWFDIKDPVEKDAERNRMMREFTQLHLDHCTTNNSGQRIGFDSTFGAAVKSGAMTVLAASVTFDTATQFVNIDAVNPFELYYDPTGRGLYRIRRTEIDAWQLHKMKKEKDSKGKPLYNKAAIERLQSNIDNEARNRREEISGGSEESTGNSRRAAVTLDEYLCVIIDRDGKLVAENQLIVFANQTEIIRGPENNPNWHGKDWIVMTPTIEVPFSVWGRSYVEVFRQLAATFTEVTNLILDGMFANSIGAHMIWTDALANPEEVTGGIYPGLAVQADEDWEPGKDFVKKIEMGALGPEATQVWSAIKAELREGASANELSLGQVPPKGDITATEIRGSERGSTTLAFNTAKDIDTRFLAPILELTMMTGLQHFDPVKNPLLAEELGETMSAMLANNRQNFAKKKYTFVANGVAAAMDRGKRLQGILGFLQVLAQSPELQAEFTREFSPTKLIAELMRGFDVDSKQLRKTTKEKREDQERAKAAAAAAAAGGDAGPSAGGSVAPIGVLDG